MSEDALEIKAGPYKADISPFGGGLWSLTYEDEPLITEPPHWIPVAFDAGCLLAPWPNRTEDGTYEFGGKTRHLSITEPWRNNSIHGFVRHLHWRERGRREREVRITVSTESQAGWPWAMDYEMRWEVSPQDGLIGEFRAVNAGDAPCPFGFGWHPYLSAFGASIDECTMKLPPVLDLPLDPKRKLPTGEPAPHAVFEEASGGGIPMSGQWFDHALRVVGGVSKGASVPAQKFSKGEPVPTRELSKSGPGPAGASHKQPPVSKGTSETPALNPPVTPPSKPTVTCQLLGPDGRGVELWAGDWCRWLQVYTADAAHDEAFPGIENGRALAIEPMTCPPNMLASGVDRLTLQPGEARCFRFGIRAL